MCSKSRDYCLTWNNYTTENYDALLALETRYIVIGKETGESGTPHLQVYFYFDNPRAFKAVQKELRGAHLEPRSVNSTPAQAAIYCKKDEDFFERGDIPKQGKRSDVEIVRDQLQAGNGMRGVVKVATSLASIKIAEMILKYEEPQRDWQPKIMWYWGLTETGKSRQAHAEFAGKDFFRKTSNTEKWWDGYDAHENVIFDDFVFPQNITEYKNWLDFFDRYSCVIQVKGGTRQFLAKTIIVTSSRNPYLALSGFEQNGKELLRRISSVTEFTKEGQKTTSA